ncbi:MAG: AraC family transcriptional regulator [Oscillospiraceae bacterium]|nr:AraC family transcriptional regulator [Oscillospiraceae bacterium]
MLNIYDADICFWFDNLKIKVIGIRYGVFFESYPRHRHGKHFYEAHLVCGGKGTLIANEREYPLTAGTLYMTGPLITHEQITDKSDPMDEYYVQFEISENKKGKGGRASELIKNTHFWIGEDNRNSLRLFEMLTEENEKQEIGYVKNVINLTSQFLVALARNYAGVEKISDYARITPDDRRALITDEVLATDYASITLKTLSKRLNLSPRQTQRFLKKTYGKTFIELRTELRQRNADKLTACGEKLSVAAACVGYKDVRSLKKNRNKNEAGK